MSSVLDRDALESSPLADLHVIANELGVDGFRRLRKADLVDAIVARQTGDGGDEVAPEPEPDVAPEPEAATAETAAEPPPAASGSTECSLRR